MMLMGKCLELFTICIKKIKSCVSLNKEQSLFFTSDMGLRQGENLSPVLFSLYLNDLESYLLSHSCKGIDIEANTADIYFYIRLLVLLYADDTVILAENSDDLQNSLDLFCEYCRVWKLRINYSKTKIIIFGARKTSHLTFLLDGNEIEIVDHFRYLGVYFSKTRTFYKARHHVVEQARKAMHLLYKRIRNFNLPIDLQLQIFDHTILPILLYGSEVWGFEEIQIIEKLHCEFLRTITKLRKSTPLYMVYAELGRFPIEINVKSRMLNYWFSLKNTSTFKFSNLIYIFMKNDNHEYKWINYIEKILQDVGRCDLWTCVTIENPYATKYAIIRTLKDQYIQKWVTLMQNSSKGKLYSAFKDGITLEKYLLTLSKNKYTSLLKFRTSNHKLPIETGRWNKTDIADRKCTICSLNMIGDEFHYLFECPCLNTERKMFLKRRFYVRPNMHKFCQLMQSTNKITLTKLSSFVQIIMNKFSN